MVDNRTIEKPHIVLYFYSGVTTESGKVHEERPKCNKSSNDADKWAPLVETFILVSSALPAEKPVTTLITYHFGVRRKFTDPTRE